MNFILSDNLQINFTIVILLDFYKKILQSREKELKNKK